MNEVLLESVIRQALQEDIGSGDITTDSAIDPGISVNALIHTKEDGVIAGLAVAAMTFRILDPSAVFDRRVEDGARVAAGTLLASVSGNARALLMAERVALNFLRHMSGIATTTRLAVDAIGQSRTRIVDTRKTTPLLRFLEKYAVRVGGGLNHRFGLYDAVLIKDNHIKLVGIRAAVAAARQKVPFVTRVEVETESLAQVSEALEAGADIIMLDNMDCATMRSAVAMIAGRALTEASGAITVGQVADIAATGVDFISMGCLTHTVRALDIGLDFSEGTAVASTRPA